LAEERPLADWLREATARLTDVSETPRLDAELIAAHAAGMARESMLLRLRDLLVPRDADALLARRLAHEPVAHITGMRDFWTLSLAVSPDVLIPRPDSETLIETAISYFRGTSGPRRILDLGTGSGALLLAALDQWPQASGLGVDASDAALQIARANARSCGMDERVRMVRGDWAGRVVGHFDLILCNPPYIPEGTSLSPEVAGHEPHAALFAGADGLDDYRRIIPDLARLLAPGAIALFEIGYDQGASVSALLAEAGFVPEVHRDLGGRDRCVAAPGVD
jgi:release factor glutamine methyltransferase